MNPTVYRHGLTLLLAAIALQFSSAVQAQIYRCVDANGRPLYTDVKVGKCQLLDTGPSQPAASAPIPAPRAPSVAAPPAPAPGSAQANFPRVDNAQQRARDNDRREILNEELRIEEKRLADLRRDFNNGEPERQGNERNYAKYQERVAAMREEIGRTERNLEALRREIGNIR